MVAHVVPSVHTTVDPTYQTALRQYDRAVAYLDIPDGLAEFMKLKIIKDEKYIKYFPTRKTLKIILKIMPIRNLHLKILYI